MKTAMGCLECKATWEAEVGLAHTWSQVYRRFNGNWECPECRSTQVNVMFEADIELLPTDKGGRHRYIADGYRGALSFGPDFGELHDVLMRFDGEIQPGEHRRVILLPLAFETWLEIETGTEFDLREGKRVIGHGVFA